MHQNVAHAALLARWSWEKLPVEIIKQAADFERQANVARRRDAIDQQVALHLGSLGISPGFGGGGYLGFNPDQAMFISVMAMIRQHNGDPPAGSKDAIAVAELVLTGQRKPHKALIAAAPPEARQLYAILLPVVRQFGFEKLFLVASTCRPPLRSRASALSTCCPTRTVCDFKRFTISCRAWLRTKRIGKRRAPFFFGLSVS